MQPKDTDSAARIEDRLEQPSEAARWLEEHYDDTARRYMVLTLPPTVVARSRRNYGAKRLFDFVVSLLSIVVLAPFLLLLGLLVRMDSKGPALFKQTRVGEGGKHFVCYKFRSMHVDVDDRLHREQAAKFLQGEKVAEEDGKPVYKLANDPRVTRMGRFIRRTSLDELPQLFNVLLGSMSLVGPRPPITYEVEQYRYRHSYRLLVKPGITGIWQVYGRSTVDFETLVSMDLNYITDGTFWLDLKLIALTFLAILRRSGR